jgi:transposase
MQTVRSSPVDLRHTKCGHRAHEKECERAAAPCCAHCQAALTDTDQVLHGRYDKIDLPIVGPVVTRVERYAGHCHCCGGITLAPVPAGLEDGSRSA